jgi:hypothetical protein
MRKRRPRCARRDTAPVVQEVRTKLQIISYVLGRSNRASRCLDGSLTLESIAPFAIAKTLDELKEELKTLDPFKTEGYTLRTGYPSDARSKGKQRWQRTLWTDFFQNQGFHREGSDPLGDDHDTLIFRYEPR